MMLLVAMTMSWWDLDPLEVRERINTKIMSIEAHKTEVSLVEDISIYNVPCRIYGEGSSLGILFIHGGAWVAGNLDTHDHLARALCSECCVDVISVGYLNAPEGKFPFQLQECLAVLKWMQERYQKVVVAGDSAGGNMAAALCLMTRDLNLPKISAQVLINPALDLRCGGNLFRQGDFQDNQRWQAVQYLQNLSDVYHPYVSPVVGDLTNLPNTLIVIGEKDELRAEEEVYAKKLIDSIHKEVGHLAGHGARVSSYAKESIEAAVKFIVQLK